MNRDRRILVLALLAAILVVDQLAKWWAWRHVPGAQINYGGNSIVGPGIGRWYAHPLTGALLDWVDFALLSTAVAVVLRRGRSVMVLTTGALMIGGWTSNIADRLGMHYWTAPGSVRGAVDFIPLGHIHTNVADIFIVGGTLLFLLTVSVSATRGSTATGSWAPAPLRAREWTSVIAGGICLILVVGFGAITYGGVTAPSISN